MNKIVFLTVAVCLYCTVADAQMISPSVIASGGDSYQNAYAYMDVTIGEVVTETMTGTDYILTNGFQQGHYKLNYIEDGKSVNVNMRLFPNPARDHIKLSVQCEQPVSFAYKLCDLTGRMVMQGEFKNISDTKIIDLQTVRPGTYYLMLKNEKNQLIKNFKIVKL